ncbi:MULTISPECIES: hypothetical protein [unclassified Spiroplasma]|uniref:hypothetical protein n=2 Tax=Spiroplasma TaxID=2132 RepID=UPI00313F2196
MLIIEQKDLNLFRIMHNDKWLYKVFSLPKALQIAKEYQKKINKALTIKIILQNQ